MNDRRRKRKSLDSGERPTEKGRDLLDRERERRRRLEQARAEGARQGASAAAKGRGAEIPRESTLDTALNAGGNVMRLVGGAISLAAEGVGAAAVGGGLSAVGFGVAGGREVVKAVIETGEAHAREAVALGARHALRLARSRCARPIASQDASCRSCPSP